MFSPLAENPIEDNEEINQTVERNRAMIEETSSTVTVPAAFMVRIITSMFRLQQSDNMSDYDDD